MSAGTVCGEGQCLLVQCVEKVSVCWYSVWRRSVTAGTVCEEGVSAGTVGGEGQWNGMVLISQ